MAKEKKRGFFSWLGLGRQNEEHTAEPLATEKEEAVEQVVENRATEEQVLSEKQAEIASDNTSIEAEARESVAEHSTLAPGEWDSTAISEVAAETLPEVGAEPAMPCSRMAQSSAVRAKGPAWSRLEA